MKFKEKIQGVRQQVAGGLSTISLSLQPLPSLPHGCSVQWPPSAWLQSLTQGLVGLLKSFQ